MFPQDSIPAQRVKNHSNGYYAILAVLTDSHPAFVAHPVTLCKNWPEQKPNQSIFDFHSEFTEAIALRAIYMNDAQDMNSAIMMDTFMQNCTHSDYLISAARLARLDPDTWSNMTPGNLAITLNNYLSRVDSPSHARTPGVHPPRASPARFGEGSSGGFCGRPFQRCINALGEEDDIDYDAELEASLDQHMPAIIHQLTRDGPELRHCMFCGVGHTHLFDKCPILNDKRFLTSFAIRVGSAYQRTLNDAFKRQKEAHGLDDSTPSSARLPLAARINQVFGAAAHPAARINQVFGDAAPESIAPSHPDFLSPDFVPGEGPVFRQG
jgi:hypothetical protein